MVYECYMKRYVKGILEGLVKMYQMAVQRYVESKFAMKDSFMVNEMAYGNNIEETDERFMVDSMMDSRYMTWFVQSMSKEISKDLEDVYKLLHF